MAVSQQKYVDKKKERDYKKKQREYRRNLQLKKVFDDKDM